MLSRPWLRPLLIALAGLVVGLPIGIAAAGAVSVMLPDASDVLRIATGYLISVAAAAIVIVLLHRLLSRRRTE